MGLHWRDESPASETAANHEQATELYRKLFQQPGNIDTRKAEIELALDAAERRGIERAAVVADSYRCNPIWLGPPELGLTDRVADAAGAIRALEV